MNWISWFGLGIVLLLLIPNAVYAAANKNTQPPRTSRILGLAEQAGRYGCMFLMIFHAGLTEFGFASAEGFIALLEHGIGALPLLDKRGRVQDVVFAGGLDIDTHKKACAPVVIMAGGLGTRLYPYTKILPKPLIPIGEMPIVEHIIHRFADVGCSAFTMIVNYKKSMIKSYFNDLQKDYTVDYVDEDTPLGTGGGLSLLKGKVTQTFFLTNCDILIDADFGDIYQYHKEKGNVITMVCAVKHFTIPYGVVELGGDGDISGITEKPEMNFLTNTGVYVVEPSVIDGLAYNEPMMPAWVRGAVHTNAASKCRAATAAAMLSYGSMPKARASSLRAGAKSTPASAADGSTPRMRRARRLPMLPRPTTKSSISFPPRAAQCTALFSISVYRFREQPPHGPFYRPAASGRSVYAPAVHAGKQAQTHSPSTTASVPAKTRMRRGRFRRAKTSSTSCTSSTAANRGSAVRTTRSAVSSAPSQ